MKMCMEHAEFEGGKLSALRELESNVIPFLSFLLLLMSEH